MRPHHKKHFEYFLTYHFFGGCARKEKQQEKLGYVVIDRVGVVENVRKFGPLTPCTLRNQIDQHGYCIAFSNRNLLLVVLEKSVKDVIEELNKPFYVNRYNTYKVIDKDELDVDDLVNVDESLKQILREGFVLI